MHFYRKYPKVTLCIFNLIIIELLCFCSYHFALKEIFFVRQIGYYDYEHYFEKVIAEKQMSTADWYNKKFGWLPLAKSQNTNKNCLNNEYVISYGEYSQRVNPFGEDKPSRISTYGDSFTEGEEVNDDQTFQYYLSQLTGTNVKNFGVGAYGTDQALLRLEHNLHSGIDQPEVVILSVYTENSKRILGNYRPFLYRQKISQLTFKPRYFQSGSQNIVTLVENPLDTPFTEKNLRKAFSMAKKYDYWFYVNSQRLTVRFPYIVTMPLAFAGKMIEYRYDLWHAEAGRIMDHLLNRFISLSNEYNFKPVICFLPTERDTKKFINGSTLQYQDYVKRIRESTTFDQAIIIDLLEESFDYSKYYLGGLDNSCHCSPYGNLVIAKSILEHLASKHTFGQ